MAATVRCPGCGVPLRPDRLERHLASVHPREAEELRARVPEDALGAVARPGGRLSRTEQRAYLALAAVVIGGVLIFALLPRGGSGPEEGRIAPAFTLQAAGGGSVSLSSHAGHVILLDFMSPTCAACIAETHGTLVPLHAVYSSQVIFLSIDINGAQPDAAAQLLAFKAEHNATWPYLLDDGSVWKAYGIEKTPTSIIVGRDGRMTAVLEGVTTYAVFVAELDAQLAAPLTA